MKISKLNIFITPRPIWPIEGGDCIRADQMIRGLCISLKNGESVTLVCLRGFQKPNQVPAELAGIITNIKSGGSLKPYDVTIGLFLCMLNFWPLQFAYFYSHKLRKFFKSQPNAKFILHTIRGRVCISSDAFNNSYLDVCDSLSLTYYRSIKNFSPSKLISYFYLVEFPLLYFFERYKLKNLKKVAFISEQDTKYIDFKDYNLIKNYSDVPFVSNNLVRSKVQTILMIGNFRTLQNREGLFLLVKLVSQLKSLKVRLVVAGIKSDELGFRSSESLIVHGKYDNIEDLSKYNATYTACLTKISGGFQNKVIESVFSGYIPLVSRNVVAAADGILVDKSNCMVVETLEDLKNSLSLSLDKQNLILKNAQSQFSDVFSKSSVLNSWKNFFSND